MQSEGGFKPGEDNILMEYAIEGIRELGKSKISEMA